MAIPDNSCSEYFRRRAAESHRLADITDNNALKEAFLRNLDHAPESVVDSPNEARRSPPPYLPTVGRVGGPPTA